MGILFKILYGKDGYIDCSVMILGVHWIRVPLIGTDLLAK